MPLMEHLKVNGVVVCDCHNRTFYVGLEVTQLGENHIRILECTKCGKHMAIPFQAEVSQSYPRGIHSV